MPKKNQTTEITTDLIFTYQISVNDARERNHRMTIFRDCEFQTKKTRILLPSFLDDLT